MNTDPLTLHIRVLAAMVERERVGELHIAVQPEPLWIPPDDEGTERANIDDALREAGLVDGRGRLDADFLDLLPLLTTASLEYYGWLNDGEHTWSVLAASRGLQSLVAVRDHDWVTLSVVEQEYLAERFTAQLPELVAGGGRPMGVRVAELDAVAARAGERTPPPHIRDLVKVLQRPVEGSGELYVAQRDEYGHYARLEEPLHYVDTDWGRYLNYTTGTGSEAEVQIAPGTPAAIAGALEKLRASLH